MTDAHTRSDIDLTRLASLMKAFQAIQHVSTMSS